MHHQLKGIKGFSIRRRGRPAGSRALDQVHSDLFPVEKILSSCFWTPLRRATAGECASTAARGEAVPPATNRGGKVNAPNEGAGLEGFLIQGFGK